MPRPWINFGVVEFYVVAGKTNALETQHVIEAEMDEGAELVLLIFSDKAVDPAKTVGTTKMDVVPDPFA